MPAPKGVRFLETGLIIAPSTHHSSCYDAAIFMTETTHKMLGYYDRLPIRFSRV
jgi:hypothetical protein